MRFTTQLQMNGQTKNNYNGLAIRLPCNLDRLMLVLQAEFGLPSLNSIRKTFGVSCLGSQAFM